MLLAFDTSSAAVTVAVHDGSAVVAESTVVDPLRHGELLAPGIAAVLRSAGIAPRQVTGLAVGVGPGPFTGLRVGVVTARTLGAVLGVAVTGVCTLDVLAAQAVADGVVTGDFVVATDARRKEVYWARYDATTGSAGSGHAPPTRLEGPHVSRPADVGSRRPVVGHGAVLYPDQLGPALPPEHPSAAVLASLVVSGQAVRLEARPLYLRRPDAATPGRPKPVS